MNLDELLPRQPGPTWEGWFFIAIPRRGGAVRFAKWHLYRATGGVHPIARVEGLRGPAELCLFIGGADRVIDMAHPLAPTAIVAESGRLAVSGGGWRMAADGGGVRMQFEDRAAGLAADIGCTP